MAIADVAAAFADPWIAPRATLVLGATAAVGMGVAGLHRFAPRHGRMRTVVVPAATSGFIYLVIGLGCRFVVQHHRSRWQIVGLLCGVALVEALRIRRRAGMPRVATWLAGSVAVCLGVLMAKWALEPGALSDALRTADRI